MCLDPLRHLLIECLCCRDHRNRTPSPARKILDECALSAPGPSEYENAARTRKRNRMRFHQ